MGEHVLVFSLGESIAGGIPFHFVRASNNLVPRGRDSFVQQRDYYSSVTPSAVQKWRPLRVEIGEINETLWPRAAFSCKFAFVWFHTL